MVKRNYIYLLLQLFLVIIPYSLSAQNGNHILLQDTIEWNNPDSFQNDSLYINNQIKSDSFYDSLITRASKNKITKTALNLLLVKEPAKGNFIAIEDIRNEEYYRLYSGKIIRNIEIVKLDVFGPELNDTTKTFLQSIHKFGNKTHINTRKYKVRNNLFFSSGDTIDPLVLVDNERLLRNLDYIKDASIQIAEVPEMPEYVDVLIVTRDVFSFGFNLDLLNIESGYIDIYENNFAGLGHRIQGTLYINSSEKPTTGIEFNHSVGNIGRTFIKSNVQYFKAFETEKYGFVLRRNYLTYNSKWAGSIKIYQTSTLSDIRKPDTTLADVRLNYSTQDYWMSYAFLLNSKNINFKNRTRLILGLRYLNYTFYKGPQISERYNYQYHDNQLLIGSIGYSRQKYFKSNLIYGFGKTEDIPVGCLIQFNAGLEKDEFFTRPYLGFKFLRSSYFSKIGYLNINAEVGGFYYENKIEQGVVKVYGQAISNLHYINRLKSRQFLTLDYTRGINRFYDEKIYLNSNNVWGLSSDETYGIQKVSFHSEMVVFSNLFIYNFRFLFFGFGDLGMVGPENKFVFRNTLYSGIGLGFRVRNENLVFKTFQIKLAFYPNFPGDSEQFFYLISGENNQRPINLDPAAPSIVGYN
jgi:hypothetical protein